MIPSKMPSLSLLSMFTIDTMDEEFQALIKYVEHKLLVKKIMGLEIQWEDKRQQKVNEFVTKKMVVWEQAIAFHREHITWGWHPMYHIMTIVPLLQTIYHQSHGHTINLRLILWQQQFAMEKTNSLQPTPFTMMLLKTFMFAHGIGQASADPIKVGSKENIFEWM